MVNVIEGVVSGDGQHTNPSNESKDISKPIPGTTLKCLEDPSFEFEGHKPVENSTYSSQPPPAKKPAYRVLEGKIFLFMCFGFLPKIFLYHFNKRN